MQGLVCDAACLIWHYRGVDSEMKGMGIVRSNSEVVWDSQMCGGGLQTQGEAEETGNSGNG